MGDEDGDQADNAFKVLNYATEKNQNLIEKLRPILTQTLLKSRSKV